MDPPPYTPRPTPLDFETASIRSAAPSYTSAAPSYRPSSSGLPSTSSSHPANVPSLAAFRQPSWSRTQHNPTARHYHSVASRRALSHTATTQTSLLAAAISGEDAIAAMKRKLDAEERERDMRTKEDPYLVGEEAARLAREERLRRENGCEVLEREDKRWDWLLAQMSDWEERDRSWKKFRREVEEGRRGRLARRLGLSKN